MVFSKGKVRKCDKFYINNEELERVDNFCYLGVTFHFNGSFKECMSANVLKAKKALFGLRKQLSDTDIDINCQLKLFDTAIVPILLYGCEVWGFENCEIIETFHRSYLRKLLGVHKSAPNCMVYGETGRYPLEYIIKRRMINFWFRVRKHSSKLSNAICRVQEKLGDLKWYSSIKNILNEAGIPHVHMYPEHANAAEISSFLKTYYTDLHQQKWATEVSNNSLANVYKSHKTTISTEFYLKVLPRRIYRDLAKFRCASPKFQHVQYRYGTTTQLTCPLCEAETEEHEFHLLLECKHFDHSRPEFIPLHYRRQPSLETYRELMHTTSISQLKSLSSFCGFILSFFE